VTPWSRRARTLAAVALGPLLWPAPDGSAQEVRGRIVDAENGAAVGLAAIFLLDAERNPMQAGAADIEGNYRVVIPGAGEYYLVVERLGYFENESPLFAVGAAGTYAVDFEMRPEPIRLDPLQVTVDNESLERFLTLRLGVHPATLRGYRSIQGVRLQEAKLKAKDNTDLLRWLYVPVSHGSSVCIGSYGGSDLPEGCSGRVCGRFLRFHRHAHHRDRSGAA
jgi:hypothetical protein